MDRFTDDQCACFLRTIRLRRWWIRFAALLVWALSFVVLVFLFPFCAQPLFHNPWVNGFDRMVLFRLPCCGEITPGDLFVTSASVLLVIGLPMLFSVFTRDQLLGWALDRHILGARCPGCRQSLLGLPIDFDEAGGGPRTRCPECGRVWMLRDLGLAPADLRPDAGPVGVNKDR